MDDIDVPNVSQNTEQEEEEGLEFLSKCLDVQVGINQLNDNIEGEAKKCSHVQKTLITEIILLHT